jgi:hypothetical protein
MADYLNYTTIITEQNGLFRIFEVIYLMRITNTWLILI